MSLLAAFLLAQVPPPQEPAAPPTLPARPWYGARTRALASQYSFCRSRGVEGMIPVETVAEGRAQVAMLIYARRARCHRERARFLASLGADARRQHSFPGEEEYLLDTFDRNIDENIQSGFDWGGLPER